MSAATVQERQQRLAQILTMLQDTYPDARCALLFSTPLELLIATILSAQCTDERVNVVTRTLFQKYSTAADYAAADFDELAKDIQSTGFYRQKAQSIQRCCAHTSRPIPWGNPRNDGGTGASAGRGAQNGECPFGKCLASSARYRSRYPCQTPGATLGIDHGSKPRYN